MAVSNVERKVISPENVHRVPEEGVVAAVAVPDVSTAGKEGTCQENALNQNVDVNYPCSFLYFLGRLNILASKKRQI